MRSLLMTFDFVFEAYRSECLMSELKSAVENDSDTEVCTEIERLRFDSKQKTVTIEPYSATSPFQCKIVPTEITYDVLCKMLAGTWEGICFEDFKYL